MNSMMIKNITKTIKNEWTAIRFFACDERDPRNMSAFLDRGI